ncbi:unnamed protein product [marine sediment metagenome]|uniref:G domain-containing protein n=1 Tax=marine sediment metagenome TaxID=412755 RepID=X1EN86_9ZZZZ
MSSDQKGRSINRKNVLFGLDNAGKTSILEVLSGLKASELSVTPTQGMQIKKLSYLHIHNIYFWDVGGQLRYRNEEYVKEADAVLFVIDASDVSRFGEGEVFFQKIITKCSEFSIVPPIVLLFHKWDLINENDETSMTEIKKLQSELVKNAKNNSQNITTYKTSIYDLESLVSAFSFLSYLCFHNAGFKFPTKTV